MIELNKFGKKIKYNKEKYLNKFIPLVLKIAPSYESFYVSDLNKNIDLVDTEIFKELASDIKLYLINNQFAILDGSSNIKLTELGRNYFNNIEKEKIEFRNLELQNEVSELTKINLNLQNTHLKRYILFSIISFVVGAILTNLKDIIALLNKI